MQLSLQLESLADRLVRLGLDAAMPVCLTRNRCTMLSWHRRKGLRLHAGFAAAPDEVLLAIVRFLRPFTRRADRLAARRTFMAFPVDRHAPSREARAPRRATYSDADMLLIDRLLQSHRGFNQLHFNGALHELPIELSSRMKRRLGEFRWSPAGSAGRIIISRRHLRRDGWDAARETLLHEMVHQWQAEHRLPIDHGPEFRRMARQVGISPRAVAVPESR